MTPTQKAAMEQMLAALESLFTFEADPDRAKKCGDAVLAGRAALAETAEPRLTVDALRVEFEKRYKGCIGATRLDGGRFYLSPAVEREWVDFVRQYTAPQPPAPAVPDSPTARLQQVCVDWGVYWRASDAHGVALTGEQAAELLRDALGVEVEIKAPAVELTDGQCDAIFDALADWAEGVDREIFGLPYRISGGQFHGRKIIRAAIATHEAKKGNK